jgi:hypothetical protein
VQRHRFAGVVLGYERVMRNRWERRGKQAENSKQHVQLIFYRFLYHGTPPADLDQNQELQRGPDVPQGGS